MRFTKTNRNKGQFSDDQIREIRKRIDAGEKQKDIAKQMGCSPELISKIHRRKAYLHVIYSEPRKEGE